MFIYQANKVIVIRTPEIGYFYGDRGNLGDYLQPCLHSDKADYIKVETVPPLIKEILSDDELLR